MKRLMIATMVLFGLFSATAWAEKPTLEVPAVAASLGELDVPPPIPFTTYNGTSFTIGNNPLEARMDEPGYLKVPLVLTAGDISKPVYYRLHSFGGLRGSAFPLGSIVLNDAKGQVQGLITSTTVPLQLHFIWERGLKPGTYFGWTPIWLSTDQSFQPKHLRYLRLHVRLTVGGVPNTVSVEMLPLSDLQIPADPINESEKTVLRYAVNNKTGAPVTINAKTVLFWAGGSFFDRVLDCRLHFGKDEVGPFMIYTNRGICVGASPCVAGNSLVTDPYILPPGQTEITVDAHFASGLKAGETIQFWFNPGLVFATNASGQPIRVEPNTLLKGPVLTVGG